MILTTLIILLIALTSYLIYEHISIEKEYLDRIYELGIQLDEAEDEILELNEVIFRISPSGYSKEVLCDRENPWHTQIHWYLEGVSTGTLKLSEKEVKRYEDLIELNKWYLYYREQPLQGFRNNSIIWEKSWCHKWFDGLGPYGIGHEHWIAGEFEYNWKTNADFKKWLTNGGQTQSI